MISTNPYLQFNGNCEEAVNFYAKVLGTKVAFTMKYKDAPQDENCSPESAEKVMHTRLIVGQTVIMASDCPPNLYHKPAGYSLNVGVDTSAEAERIYKALSEGGTQTMPIAETFWAHRFGMCVDRFGTPWMVNCEKQQA